MFASSTVILLCVVLLLLLFLIILFVFYTDPKSTVGVVQQLTIPNFQGNEGLLQSLSSNRVIVKSVVTPSEVASAVRELYWSGAKRIVLQVTSSALFDNEVSTILNEYKDSVQFVSTASTLEAARDALPFLYYLLPLDETILNNAFYGYVPPLAVAQKNVFIGAGTDPYVAKSLEIAEERGLYVIDATSLTDFTTEQIDAISGADAVFIVAFPLYQQFVISQLPTTKLLLFVNLPPTSNFTYPTTEVRILFPSSNILQSPSSKWTEAVRGYTVLAPPWLQSLPMLVSADSWKPYIDTQTFLPSQSLIWSGVV
jgi:hypothetical protein